MTNRSFSRRRLLRRAAGIAVPGVISSAAVGGQGIAGYWTGYAHVLGHLLLAHEALVQPAAATAGQDLRRHLEGVELACAEGRRAVAHVHALQGHVIGHDLALRREEPDRCPMQISFTPEFADRLRADMGVRSELNVARGGEHNPHGGGNTYELERAIDSDLILTSVGWATSSYAGHGTYTDECPDT